MPKWFPLNVLALREDSMEHLNSYVSLNELINFIEERLGVKKTFIEQAGIILQQAL